MTSTTDDLYLAEWDTTQLLPPQADAAPWDPPGAEGPIEQTDAIDLRDEAEPDAEPGPEAAHWFG